MSDATSECRNCRGGPETFWYLKRNYIFDVDRARSLTRDGREPLEIDDESVRAGVAESDINETHLDHIDPAPPGIIAHVFYREPAGDLLHGHVLIDGHHRAALALRDGRPFFAYLLDETESQAILLDRPNNLPEFLDAIPPLTT